MPNRAAWAEVDLGAIRANYEAIKRNIRGGAKLCAVVKADAYGHGAIPVARVAVECGAAYLAVATVSEAIELRQAGFTTPILLLGVVRPEDAGAVVDYDVTQVVCQLELAQALSEEAVRRHKVCKVHLKVETGMGRIGVRPEEIGVLAAAVKQLPGIEIEGMFSHFAMADRRDKAYTKMQLAKFEQAIKAVEAAGVTLKIRHIAESAAILEIPEAHYDMVRAGIIQYGLWPSDEVTQPIDLRPAMKLQAQVVFLKTVHPGESIGYGRTFVRAPIAGRVCMDQVMVDVTDIPDVAVGDVATLWGSPTLTVDEAAGWLDTINYELPCLISPRVPRVYVEK